MFTHIFFLFLLLLIIGAAPVPYASKLPSLDSLAYSLVIYIGILAIIMAQNLWILRKRNQEKLLLLTNIELLLYFAVVYFVIGAQRVFYTPLFNPYSDTVLTAYTLLLYFFGLYMHHLTAHIKVWGRMEAMHKARKAVTFMLPFAIPFFVLITLADTVSLIPLLPLPDAPWVSVGLSLFAGLASLAATMVLLPSLLIYAWDCTPLDKKELVERFNAICDKAQFKHGGFKVWKAMEASYNAAIIGVVGKLRYVMFTPKLLNRLSPDALEAILAHEIGHSRHRHLFIYPWILFGMVLTGSMASYGADILLNYFTPSLEMLTGSEYWESLHPFMLFIPFVISAALYFRYVFGYFSRLFEKQADLFLFEVGINPTAMIEALDEIGKAAGGIHKHPSWHHGSIHERMEFLRLAEVDRRLIEAHHRKVRLSLLWYTVVIVCVGVFLQFLG